MQKKRGRKPKGSGEVEKGLNQFLTYSQNPTTLPNTVDELRIYQQKRAVTKEVFLEEDGNILHENQIHSNRNIIADKKQFVKLFPDVQRDMVKLSHSGLCVLSYILSNLIRGRDEIELHYNVFTPFYQKLVNAESDGKMTCYRGIVNLLESDFIYRKVGGASYFINANKFFKGNRTSLPWVQELVKGMSEGKYISPASYLYSDDKAQKAKDNKL